MLLLGVPCYSLLVLAVPFLFVLRSLFIIPRSSFLVPCFFLFFLVISRWSLLFLLFIVHHSLFIGPRLSFLVSTCCSLLLLFIRCYSFLILAVSSVHRSSILVHRSFFIVPRFALLFLAAPCCSLLFLASPCCFFGSSFIVPTDGEGGQKWSKKCPRRLWTAPSHVLKARIASCTHIFIAISCPLF